MKSFQHTRVAVLAASIFALSVSSAYAAGNPNVDVETQAVLLVGLIDVVLSAGGHTEFELHARVENLAAIAFYEAAGWTVTDRLVHTVEHGISYNEQVLVKHRP